MEFFVYDLIFLFLFLVFVVVFLVKNKASLKREGLIFLYRAKWGMNLIDYIGEKYTKTLHFLKYVSISLGFVLMGTMIYLLWKNLYLYIKIPELSQIIKAPPIAPLIPYFPKLYGMESLFPPFYFTYFLIALGIVAITHEFSHGIFMRLFNIKIKSTGLAFFGPFLGAFVEEDKNSFTKKNNLGQMSVLSAGAFANIITAIVFFLVLIAFFYISFSPGGYSFNTYTYSFIPINESEITNQTLGNLTIVYYQNSTYYLDGFLRQQLGKNLSNIAAYDNTPAVISGLTGTIIKIDKKRISNQNSLKDFMSNSSPGQRVLVVTDDGKQLKEYNFTLAKNPIDPTKGYLGVGFLSTNPSGIFARFISLLKFKDPSTNYVPRYDGSFAYFIYYLFWWVALISALVGLFNMLPLGILDGGRFFYLAVLSITKSKKISEYSFKIISALILFVFLFLTLIWFVRLF